MFDCTIPPWFWLIMGSAAALGFYDILKKKAVKENSVMPTLFFATLTGSVFFILATVAAGNFATSFFCSKRDFWLLVLKSVIVGASWIFVYYAMRELPISIVSPIRASAPLWTLIGGVVLFSEIPSWGQAIGMALIFGGYYCFSVLGKLEGISFRRHKGIKLIIAGTILGAAAALYDKYLLGTLGIPRQTVQLWFSIDLVFFLGAVCLIRKHGFKEGIAFEWRWSIPAVGIMLIIADYLYFMALSMPEVQISILSLLRRTNCVVTFAFGAYLFREQLIQKKALALTLILLGVVCIALAKNHG